MPNRRVWRPFRLGRTVKCHSRSVGSMQNRLTSNVCEQLRAKCERKKGETENLVAVKPQKQCPMSVKARQNVL